MGPDPTAIDDVARSLDVVAAGVGEVGRNITRAVQATGWQGKSAELFRQAAAGQSRALARQAEELRAAAAEVRRVAEATRQELATLHAMEAGVWEAFVVLARHATPAGEPPWASWRWRPDNLPARGDPAWREAAGWLRSIGAVR